MGFNSSLHYLRLSACICGSKFNSFYSYISTDGKYFISETVSPTEPWLMVQDNDFSTKFNCSWQKDFDPAHMEYDKIGLTNDFPKEYSSFRHHYRAAATRRIELRFVLP